MKKNRYDTDETRWYPQSTQMIYHDSRSFKSCLSIIMKKILFICIFFFGISQGVFAANPSNDCESITDEFAKYQCNTQKICKQYDENKKVFNIEIYKNAESYKKAKVPGDVLVISDTQINILRKAITIYKENMNSVYKCAVVQAQKNSYNKILRFI